MDVHEQVLFTAVLLALVNLGVAKWGPMGQLVSPSPSPEDIAATRSIVSRAWGVGLIAFVVCLPFSYFLFGVVEGAWQGWLEKDGAVVFFLLDEVAKAGIVGLAVASATLGAVDWFCHRADPAQRAAAQKVVRLRSWSMLWFLPACSMAYGAFLMILGGLGLTFRVSFGPESMSRARPWAPGVQPRVVRVLAYRDVTHLVHIAPGGKLGKYRNRSRTPEYWVRGRVEGEDDESTFLNWDIPVWTERFQEAWKRIRKVSGVEVLHVASDAEVAQPWRKEAAPGAPPGSVQP